MSYWKIRITAENEQDAALLIAALQAVLPGYKSRAARQGNNPKYDGKQQWLAYGEMSAERSALEHLLEKPAQPMKAPAKRKK